MQRMLGNAVPSLVAEILGREIRRQLLDAPMSGPLHLLPPRRKPIPPPVKEEPLPKKYHAYIGKHEAHPGTGKGRLASQRHKSVLSCRGGVGLLAYAEGGVGELLKLLLGEKPAVRQAGPLVLQIDDALDLGLEGLADLVQQVGQGPVIGGLLDPGARSADLGKLLEVDFQGIHGASPGRHYATGEDIWLNLFEGKM